MKTVLMSSRSEKFGPPRSVTVEGAPPRREVSQRLDIVSSHVERTKRLRDAHTSSDALLTTIVV